MSQVAYMVIFGFLNILDAWTTWQVLRFGGKEVNPELRLLFTKFGLRIGLAIAKIGVVLVVWLLMYKHVLNEDILIWMNFGYLGLVANNMYQLMKQKEIVNNNQ